MDEGEGSAVDTASLPRLLAVRCDSPNVAGLWHQVAELPDGRLGVAIGRSPDTARAGRIPADLRRALLADPDPAAALGAVADPDSPALCAVIDPVGARMAYSSAGGLVPVLAGPRTGHRVLDAAIGTSAGVDLPPGASVLLCTGHVQEAAGLLDGCASAAPWQAAGQIAAALGRPGTLIVLYRQSPDPLELRLPAEPASLSGVRTRLRSWLALAGVDAETADDVLLAVGEAAANVTEHSVAGAAHPVELTVRGSIDGHRLRFTVSDNGCWRPAKDFAGHRGHGLKLINALVDTADLTTGEQGTTVEMLKELRP